MLDLPRCLTDMLEDSSVLTAQAVLRLTLAQDDVELDFTATADEAAFDERRFRDRSVIEREVTTCSWTAALRLAAHHVALMEMAACCAGYGGALGECPLDGVWVHQPPGLKQMRRRSPFFGSSGTPSNTMVRRESRASRASSRR